MKSYFKKHINKVFNTVGLEFRTVRASECFERSAIVNLEEYIQLYRANKFSGLPAVDGRNRLLRRLTGAGICEGMHIVEYLNRSLEVDGDVCEFGVGSGATSALIANEIRHAEKAIWLFDSFQGLPKPTKEDILINDFDKLGGMEFYQGRMKHSINEVKTRLNEIDFQSERVKIIPGFIEETIKLENLPNKVCFAYIDFDFYQPIKIALEYIRKVMQINGYVIVDDYNFFSSGAKTAVDEFVDKYSDEFSTTISSICTDKFIVLNKRNS